MMLWHYTVKACLSQILRGRMIKPATAGVPSGEKLAVWFSSNEEWEETANKMYMDACGKLQLGTKESTHKMAGGLARIGVSPETAPHNWNDFKRLSGIRPKDARALYQAAIESGARPGEWYVSFEPVPSAQWLTVEVFTGTVWIPHSDGK